MSKELTEKWRNGTLRGCFYWKLPNGNICTAYTDTMRDIKSVMDSDEVEVLQETPSYVEYNELVQKMQILKKQLDIATKALKYYAQCKHINLDLVTIREGCAEFEAFEDGEHARKALKEMEEV